MLRVSRLPDLPKRAASRKLGPWRDAFGCGARSGTALMWSSDDPRTPGRSVKADRRIVVSEAEAAQILRVGRRGVDVIEVIEDETPPTKKKLPG